MPFQLAQILDCEKSTDRTELRVVDSTWGSAPQADRHSERPDLRSSEKLGGQNGFQRGPLLRDQGSGDHHDGSGL